MEGLLSRAKLLGQAILKLSAMAASNAVPIYSGGNKHRLQTSRMGEGMDTKTNTCACLGGNDKHAGNKKTTKQPNRHSRPLNTDVAYLPLLCCARVEIVRAKRCAVFYMRSERRVLHPKVQPTCCRHGVNYRCDLPVRVPFFGARRVMGRGGGGGASAA